MFIDFANFYQRLIWSFSRIVVLLISLLKTIESLEELALKAFKVNDNEVISGGSNKTNRTVMNLSKNKKSKNLIHLPNIKLWENLTF